MMTQTFRIGMFIEIMAYKDKVVRLQGEAVHLIGEGACRQNLIN